MEKTKEAVEKAIKYDQPSLLSSNPLAGTEEAVLFEVLLKSGLEMALANKEITCESIDGQKVFIALGIAYYVLGNHHSDNVFREIAKRKPERVIASEKGFVGNDALKANTTTLFRQMDSVKFEVV